jgi:putative tryptophan/tyrosine transport system substrate-binding protein
LRSYDFAHDRLARHRCVKTRRLLLRSCAIWVAFTAARAWGQPTERIPRIGLVFGAAPLAEMVGPDPIDPSVRALVHSLRDLGLIDGRNIVLERRSAEGQGPERMSALMQEMVALGVDVIVTTGAGVSAAQRATDRIAIVGMVDTILDTGLVESLARPGRNVTGIGVSSAEGYGKELQLLKEAAPAVSRVAVVANRPLPGQRESWRLEIDAAASKLRMKIVWVAVDAAADFEAAFATIVRERADAIDVISNHINHAHRRRIAEFALRQRLPSIGFPEDGMLLDYSADQEEVMRRVAAQVKQILGGARPGDLPFEQPTRFVLTLNLKTANALRLKIPQALLLQAEKVIR